LLRWLKQLLPARHREPSPTGPSQTVFQALRLIKAKYDAAATTDENRRHWRNADDLSANAANSAEVRRLLRIRCRYEVAGLRLGLRPAGVVAARQMKVVVC